MTYIPGIMHVNRFAQYGTLDFEYASATVLGIEDRVVNINNALMFDIILVEVV